MFAVSSPRHLVSVVLLSLLTGSILFGLSGCGKEEAVDPYAYDSMRRIMSGDTLSVGFLFEIDAPEMEYVKGDVGIVRTGNQLNFLVGEDLEHNYRNLAGSLLGVQKTFTPQPTHLVIKRIKRDGVVVQDSLAAPTGYVLPTLMRSGAVDLETPGAPLPEIGHGSKAITAARDIYLPEEEDGDLKPIQTVIMDFVYAPRHDAEVVELEEGAVAPELEYAWYAVFEDAAIEITELTEGAVYMMELLKSQDMPLIGSFSVLYLEDQWSKRKIDHEGLGHVIGTMKINWFKYANTFVKGCASE